MGSNFPGSLDNWPSAGNVVDLEAAVEAIETKVGANGSADSASLDFLSRQMVRRTGGGREAVVTVDPANAAAVLNLANGNVFVVRNPVAGGTCTLTLAGATAGEACGCTVLFQQRASGDSGLAFAGTVRAMNEGVLVAPAQEANAVASYSIVTLDGGSTLYVWKTGDSNALIATVPGVPTAVIATAGNGNASVAFSAPSDGGSAITGYTVTSTPGGILASGGASPIVVSGLTNGTAYTFTVHATNAVGNGGESAPSNSVTPASGPSVPGAPTIGVATAGNTTATANWTAPGSDGGSAITGYQVKTYDNAGGLLATDAVGVVLTYTKTGLTNGTAVKFKVAAVNAIGTGAQSAFSNAVTPAAPASPGFADDFNRANGALGTSTSGDVWTSSGMTIDGNKARRTSPAGAADIDSGLADFSLEVVCTNGPAGGAGELGFQARKIDGNNYWYCAVAGDNLYFLKFEAGVLANITSAIVVDSNVGTHTFKITGIGNDLKFYVDGVLKLSLTHAFNATATRHGIGGGNVFATDTASTYDDVVCVAAP